MVEQVKRMCEAAGSHLTHVSGLVLNGEVLAPDLHPMKAKEQTKCFCRLAHPLDLEATTPGSTAGGTCLGARRTDTRGVRGSRLSCIRFLEFLDRALKITIRNIHQAWAWRQSSSGSQGNFILTAVVSHRGDALIR